MSLELTHKFCGGAIFVDTYARWRIIDPLLFFQRVRNELGAQVRLDDILDGETRNAVARHDLIEIVRTSNREPVNTTTTDQEEPEVLEPITTGREQITRRDRCTWVSHIEITWPWTSDSRPSLVPSLRNPTTTDGASSAPS